MNSTDKTHLNKEKKAEKGHIGSRSGPGLLLALYDIPETFVPQFKEITELANSINIHLQDGRPVRFDFTPIPTPQTAP